jgi:ankyrin repeat protein
MWLAAAALTAIVSAAAEELVLLEAVKSGESPAEVARLIRSGAQVNQSSADGARPLHWAAHRDDARIAKLLIDAGAEVNAATDLGVTPLLLACSDGSGALVELLLRAGAKPDLATSNNETPLMTCARRGNLPGVKALLAAGATVGAAEAARGQTALMWAAARGQSDVVQVLIENGADVNARSIAQPLVVSRGNRYGGVGLVNRGIANTGQGGSTPLLFAARNGDVATARLLVRAGADVNATGQDANAALVVAAHSGHGRLAAYLLEAGADPNVSGAGYTALHAAILRGDLALVDALLARGADPNAPLKSGTAVRRYSQDYAFNEGWVGATPFWLAARFAEPGIMRALIARGANATATLKDKTTALMAAAGLGSNGVLAGSLSSADRRERRVDPVEAALRDRDEEERRALEAVTIALQQGADVSAVNDAGDTALHGAAANGYVSVIRLLAERGAALGVKNRRGQTPLALATARASEAAASDRTVHLLRELGAKE